MAGDRKYLDWVDEASQWLDEGKARQRENSGRGPSTMNHTSQAPAVVAAPSTEAGLGPALEFIGGMAASTRSGITKTETAIAALQAGDVSGDALTGLQQAMEGLGRAASAYDAAHATLREHTQVGEAYHANPGAGTREFVISE